MSASSINLKSIINKFSDKNEKAALNHWTGTFQQYLELVRDNPKVTRNAYQRMYDMIIEHGTVEYKDFKKDVVHYKFFDDIENNGKDAVFGLDVQLMKLVNVLKAAALGYGTEKRVILLHGPVGSAKSTICRRLKKGLEVYSRTPNGSLFTFEWVDEKGELEHLLGKGIKVYPTPMNEEPLLLIPEEMRKTFCEEMNRGLSDEFRVKIDGELCPPSRFIFKGLMEKYGGDLEKVLSHIRVKRMFISEADRVGVGTFQPKDEKNQDSTELTGDINYRKIAEYGSDSDPRAFNFDGEFNVANRGMIEFVEVLKLDVAFLYDLLGASQEHRIKPKKFAQTHIDEVIIGHTNEPEYRRLQDNEFMEALRDRTVKIDIPYITKLEHEVKIYEKDFNSQKLRGISIAPHTIRMAATWAILTRLEKPKKANLTLLQKLKLYNGDNKSVANYTEDNVREMRKEAVREGFAGISPRYIQDKLSNAIILAQQSNNGFVSPDLVYKELESGLKHHSLISNEELKSEYRELLKVVEEDYKERIKLEVEEAYSSDEKALHRLCINYIDNVKIYTQKERVRNSQTGAEEQPNETLMRSIETKIDILESRKDDFRRDLMNYIGALAVEGKKFDYKADMRLYRALQLKLFDDHKDRIKIASVISAMEDKDLQETDNVAISILINKYGYDDVSARYVINRVNRDIWTSGNSQSK